MIRNLVLDRCCSDDRFDVDVYNLLDHLIPYYLFFGGGLLVSVAVTVLMWFVTRPRRQRQF